MIVNLCEKNLIFLNFILNKRKKIEIIQIEISLMAGPITKEKGSKKNKKLEIFEEYIFKYFNHIKYY